MMDEREKKIAIEDVLGLLSDLQMEQVWEVLEGALEISVKAPANDECPRCLSGDLVDTGKSLRCDNCEVDSVYPPLREIPKLVISRDHSPWDPRELYDHLGVMHCWHPRHELGDIKHTVDPNDWFRDNVRDGDFHLPLYLHDHGGLVMSCDPFSCRWDSSQIGWIVVKKAQLDTECGSNVDLRKVEDTLRSEVAEYNYYLSGNVWWCGIGDESCDGFLGDTLEGTGILDYIKESGDPLMSKLSVKDIEAAWEARE